MQQRRALEQRERPFIGIGDEWKLRMLENPPAIVNGVILIGLLGCDDPSLLLKSA
jgi:hypothetical protein